MMSDDEKKFSFTADMLKDAAKTMDHVETKESVAGVKQMGKCEDCGETQEVDLPEVGKEDEMIAPEHHGKPMKPFITKQ